jgi:hypothetical protein
LTASKAEILSHRFLDVQGSVSELMVLVRMLRTGDREALPGTLQLVENALFAIGGELMMIPATLAEAEAAIAAREAEQYALLLKCQDLLHRYEAQAVANGLLPAIVADRRQRQGTVEVSFDGETAELPLDLPPEPQPSNVVAMPVGFARRLQLARHRDDTPQNPR